MTAQTIAYLKGTEFTLTGAPARITEYYMHDLIDTLRKRSSNYDISDPEYGAIGDGNSHPLSGITLWGGTNTTGFTAAQWNTLLYGTATPTLGGQSIAIASTAAEIDGVALQLAIYTASVAKGGLVTMGAGHYRLNQTIYMPNSALVNNSTPINSVNILGDGRENTVLEWSELGTSTFAMTVVSRAVAFPASAGYWQDFTICGPNAAVALGASPANMHGFGWASGRAMLRIGIVGFRGGLCIPTGDQTQFYDIRTWNCYFGTYFDITSSATGDMMFERYSSNTNMRACIGVSNTSEITGCIWIKGFIGTSPYAVFKEGGGANTNIIGESKFIHCQFEQIGNSCMGDGLAFGAHTCFTSGNVEFDYCQFSPNPGTYKIAAETATGFVCMVLQNTGQISVRYPTYLGSISLSGFTSGFFEIDAPSAGIELTGDLDQLFGTVLAGLPLGKSGGAPPQGSYKLHNVGTSLGPTGTGGGWEGTVCFANANPTLAVGNIVAGDSSGNRSVALSAGTTAEQILGIVVLPHTVSGGWVCVAQSGYAPRVLSNAALTNGTWVRAGASGLAVASGTKFPTASTNIGVWGNAAVTPNRGTCILQGLV